MPLIKFARNYYHLSKSGHNIYFTKNEPKEVPASLLKELVAAGGIADEEAVIAAQGEEKPFEDIPQGTDREEKIFKAFGTMMGRTNRGDFTAGGSPNCTVLSQLLGFEIQSKERDALWLKYIETPEEDRT